MPEMTKEQMIEMIQDMELIEWNKAKKMEKIMGYNASVTYEMKHRCEAIRDLMREMAIEERRIVRKGKKNCGQLLISCFGIYAKSIREWVTLQSMCGWQRWEKEEQHTYTWF